MIKKKTYGPGAVQKIRFGAGAGAVAVQNKKSWSRYGCGYGQLIRSVKSF